MKQDNSFIAMLWSKDRQGVILKSDDGRQFQRVSSSVVVNIGDGCFIGKLMNDPYTKNKRYKMAPFKIPEWITHDGYPMGLPRIWMGKCRYIFIQIN